MRDLQSDGINLLFGVGPDLGPNFQDGRLVGPISGPERPPGTSLTILESLEWVETRFWVHLEVPKPQPVPPPSGRRKALLPGSSQNPCNNEEDHGPLVEGKLGAQVLHLNENAAPAANPDVAYQT